MLETALVKYGGNVHLSSTRIYYKIFICCYFQSFMFHPWKCLFSWLVCTPSIPLNSALFQMWVKATHLSRTCWIETTGCHSVKRLSSLSMLCRKVPSPVTKQHLLSCHLCHLLICLSKEVKLWERLVWLKEKKKSQNNLS